MYISYKLKYFNPRWRHGDGKRTDGQIIIIVHCSDTLVSIVRLSTGSAVYKILY